MTPTNATAFPVYGQAYNLSVAIRSYTTGNPISGGLTGLQASISKNDGAFVNTATAASEEPASSGYVSVDLSAAEMSAEKIVLGVVSSSSGAVTAITEIHPVQLAEPTGRPDAQSILLLEQYVVQALSVLTNQYMQNQSAQTQTVYKNDSATAMLSGTFAALPTQSTRGKLS